MQSNQFWQKQISLPAKPRGFHLITHEITAQIYDMPTFDIGLLHLMLLHTSASLTINENACHDVRHDLEEHFNHFVPENAPYYQHTLEGSDDMPAHIKSSTLGCQLTLPINQGKIVLGTWQGIYLCEHRNHAASRQLILTAQGQ